MWEEVIGRIPGSDLHRHALNALKPRVEIGETNLKVGDVGREDGINAHVNTDMNASGHKSCSRGACCCCFILDLALLARYAMKTNAMFSLLKCDGEGDNVIK